MIPPHLKSRVGDLRQFANVRRIRLDDGPERGVRALAFSSGGGLDFWVLSDRSLDIGPLWWRGQALAWQGPAGFRSPAYHDPEGDAGLGFNRSFSGFLVTGGLNHIRHPAGGQPLHGRLPFTPARVLAYGEDWDRDDPILFCEGEVIQARLGAEALRLRRRIESPVAGSSLTITDTVENLANTPCRQASLYHFNLGFPALADGTMVEVRGRTLLGPLRVPDPALPSESVSYPVTDDDPAACTVSTPWPDGGRLQVRFEWSAASLPHLQLWHNLQPRVCVLSIEPCTSARAGGGLSGEEKILEPGESRRYFLRVTAASAAN
ncbi:MAG TPA: DUF4432 family protein [Acetobacteraceae bacterium]|jgi:hypothetical protein|nr:DUF4432 family protein [Acetobacteraceae bacterium]